MICTTRCILQAVHYEARASVHRVRQLRVLICFTHKTITNISLTTLIALGKCAAEPHFLYAPTFHWKLLRPNQIDLASFIVDNAIC